MSRGLRCEIEEIQKTVKSSNDTNTVSFFKATTCVCTCTYAQESSSL